MLVQREMQPELQQMAIEYPVVTLMGPRQSGKTTIVRATFKNMPYVNLESPEVRALAESDPKGFLSAYPQGAIIDEIQRVPDLLSDIQTNVDERKKNGQYILTGSHQLLLHEKISQSLAGRTALLTLLPLSLSELAQQKKSNDENDTLYQGLLPRIHCENQQPTKAYRHYLQTYIERDVRQLIHLKDLATFQKFITICASRIGQLVNYDNIANEIGVSNHTVKHWLSVLEASWVIFRLQPYHANVGKRLVKSPKLYFIEPGLAAYLLGIESVAQMQRDPLRGQLFENLVVLELMKQRYNQGLDPHLYFYRDQQQHEIDVVYKKGHQLIPIEIKSAKTFNQQFLKGIDYFSRIFPQQCEQGYIVYAGNQEQKIGWRHLLNYLSTSQITK